MYGIPYVLCRGESCMNKSVLTPKTAYLLPAHYFFYISKVTFNLHYI